jgi:hypothetical protein
MWPGLRGVRCVALVVLLAASVGAKLMHGGAASYLDPPGGEKRAIAWSLREHGFLLSEGADDPDSPFVPAIREECRVLVAAVAPQGWHRDILRRLAGPTDQVAFLVDGRLYDDQPVWQTIRRHYWNRLNRFVGRDAGSGLPRGILASQGCDLSEPMWTALGNRRTVGIAIERDDESDLD